MVGLLFLYLLYTFYRCARRFTSITTRWAQGLGCGGARSLANAWCCTSLCLHSARVVGG